MKTHSKEDFEQFSHHLKTSYATCIMVALDVEMDLQ